MMSWQHALTGALVATAPDVFLWGFGWRQDWLPETHPLVRVHRFLHSPWGLFCVAWGSHLVADWLSPHRRAPAAPSAAASAPRGIPAPSRRANRSLPNCIEERWAPGTVGAMMAAPHD